MRIVHSYVKPDTLIKGDMILNPLSNTWEPVQDAYWSDNIQRYVVFCGLSGGAMHTYCAGALVQKRRIYY